MGAHTGADGRDCAGVCLEPIKFLPLSSLLSLALPSMCQLALSLSSMGNPTKDSASWALFSPGSLYSLSPLPDSVWFLMHCSP